MTGFKDISAVAAAAPVSIGDSDVATPRSVSGSGAKAKRQTEQQKKEEEKNKAVEEALSKVGTQMMSELAALPYEAWAFFFSDPALKLTKEETETLANTYYTIAKALKPEQLANWKILLALALLQNLRLVIVKMRLHTENVEKQRKLMANDETKGGLQEATVTIV